MAEPKKAQLLNLVYGQEHAITAVRIALRLRQLGPRKTPQPQTFVFVGPEGCGKSFTAEHLGLLEGGEETRPVFHIPMGTYQNDNEAAGLIGLRKIYTNARPGDLTSFVRENPNALLIFEDFDRAHPNVQEVLAPMLAKGRLVDQCGFYAGDLKNDIEIAPAEVDFSDTLIVFTTSLGRNIYDDEVWAAQLESNPGLLNNALIQELGRATADTFGNDMPVIGRNLLAELAKQEWMLFRRLDLAALLRIAERELAQLAEMARHAGYAGLTLGEADNAASRCLLLTALVLANGPEPKPAMLQAGDLARLLLAPLLAGSEATGELLAVDLSKAAKTSLQNVLAELGEHPLRNLFRKHATLSCRVHIEAHGEAGLAIVLDGCELKRVPNRQDFEGQGGLAVDLPEQTFSDIAGHVEAKRRLREVIGMLHSPQMLAKWAVAAPRGMLLYGPPGTGKTMLARAFASEADLPFIATTGSELLDPRRVGRVFALARQYAPAAVFIDEIDALGRRDAHGASHAINQLLAEIDGFDNQGAHRIFVIAASNLPERIDPAILRSGRLDLHIQVPALDRAARAYFIDQLRPMAQLPDEADWQHIIELSAGMTGADLEKLRRELAYDLLREGKLQANRPDIVEHINTIKYGVRDSRERTREELEHIAYHEAGHILLSQLLNPEARIRNVSITGRGNAAGFVEFDTESHHGRRMTRKEVKEELIILMGGRAAQVLKFGEDGIDAGAADDLAKAKDLANRAIVEWRMDDVLECELSSPQDAARKYIPNIEVVNTVADKLEFWLLDSKCMAIKILSKNFEKVNEIAAGLLDDGFLARN